MSKKIIFFENLDYINFIISLIYLLSDKEIYYRYSSIKFTYFNFLKKKYQCVGLQGKDGSYANKAFYLKKYLVRKYIKNNINLKFFESFCKLINLDKKKIRKLQFSLENYFYDSKILVIDTSSYVLSKKIFPNYKVIYYTESLKSHLILNEIKSKHFISSNFFFISFVFKIISSIIKVLYLKIKNNLIKFIVSKIKKKIKNQEHTRINLKEAKKNQVGYFPHRNLYFGDFFSKTFLFDKDSFSPLHKDNIDVLFFEETDNLSKRYLNIFKINKIIINIKSKIPLNDLIKIFKFFYKNIKFIKKNKISIIFVFLEFFYGIKKFNYFFEKKNYKFLIFYNDYLVPNTLLLSADINNIKTISFQDRLTSYIYLNKVFFDYYLTAGLSFSKKFNNIFFIEKIENVGLLRSKLIDIPKFTHEKFRNKITSFRRKNYKVVTVLFLTENSKNSSNLNGEDGTSIESNLELANTILNFSKTFEKVFFIIKFKDENYKKFKTYKKLLDHTNHKSNLEIIQDDKLSSANIISQSDIVIGKQSTIIEESLLKKKYAFIYDTENFVSTFGFYKKKENKFFVKKNVIELENTLKLILKNDKNYLQSFELSRKIFCENYLSDMGRVNDFNFLRDRIRKYIETVND